jgi:hypothetical protein
LHLPLTFSVLLRNVGAAFGGEPTLKRTGNSATHLPAFNEMSFAAKPKDDHSEDDVIAMKQLGKSGYCGS